MNKKNFERLKKYSQIHLIDTLDSFNEKNQEIGYVYLNNHISNKKEYFKKFKKKDNLFLFSWQYFRRGYLTTLADLKAYQNIDFFYEKFEKKNNLLIRLFKFLYRSDKFEIALKKNILVKVKNQYEIKIIKRIISFITKKEVLENLSEKELINDDNKGQIKNYLRRSLIFFLYPFYISFSNKFIFKPTKTFFTNYYRLYENGAGVKNLGNLDWLIENEENIKKKNIFVFEDIDHKRSRHTNELKKNNFNLIDCNNKIQSGYISFAELIKNIIFLAPLGAFLSIYLLFFKKTFFIFFYQSWLSYFKWSNFIKFNSGKNYIVYHNYQDEHILRNIFLKKNNFNLIHYKHTSSENIFNYKIKDKYNNAHQAFVYYDKEFHQTKQSIEMSEQNNSLSSEKIICGPTFKLTKKLNILIKKKQVCFFNSAFSDGYVANTIESHFNFLKFLDKFLKRNDFRVIFKSKDKIETFENYNSSFKNLMDSIKKNKNVSIIDYDLDLNEIIYQSQISIHMPFASTGIISLNLKKKFFFYDSLNFFRNSYFSKFDKLKLISTSEIENYEFLDFYSKIDQTEYEKYIHDCFLETFGYHYNNSDNIIKKYL
jgi:hypothetical protein